MKTLTLKKISIFALTALILVVPMVVLAQDPFGVNYGRNSGLGTGDVRNVVVSLINVLLGILGVVALVIILIGGFRWMTSGGNEESVASARQTIAAGIIGLIIIFVAYAVTVFIFNVLESAI